MVGFSIEMNRKMEKQLKSKVGVPFILYMIVLNFSN